MTKAAGRQGDQDTRPYAFLSMANTPRLDGVQLQLSCTDSERCDGICPSSRVAVAESLLDDLARFLARMTLDMNRGDLPSPEA